MNGNLKIKKLSRRSYSCVSDCNCDEKRIEANQSKDSRELGLVAEAIRRQGTIHYRAIPRSSYKGHRVDALAPGAEEGRGRLRKVTGSRLQA